MLEAAGKQGGVMGNTGNWKTSIFYNPKPHKIKHVSCPEYDGMMRFLRNVKRFTLPRLEGRVSGFMAIDKIIAQIDEEENA